MQTISLRKYPEMIPLYERNIPNLRNTLNKTNNDVLVDVDEYDYYISHKIEPTINTNIVDTQSEMPQESKKRVTVKPEALEARKAVLQESGLQEKEEPTPKEQPIKQSSKILTIHLQAIVLPKQEEQHQPIEQSDIALELPKPEPIEVKKQTEKQVNKVEILAESLGMGVDAIKKALYLIENKCFLPYIAKACGCSVRSIAIIKMEI